MASVLPVMILSGGVATRLGAVAENKPKAMVEVAGAPFVEHQLKLLAGKGIKDVIICVSHLSEQIEEFVGDGSRFKLSVRYSHDGPVRLGTGGSVKKATKLIEAPFSVLYGDTYLDINYKQVFKAYAEKGKMGLMTVLENSDQFDKSNVLCRNGKILAYSKSEPHEEMRHVDYGFSVFSPSSFERYPEGIGFDLAEVFDSLIDQEELAAFEVTQRFYEIGTPESLAETNEYLKSKRKGKSKGSVPV